MLTTGFQSFAKIMNKKSFVVAVAMIVMLAPSANADCLTDVRDHKPPILNTGQSRMATTHQEGQWDKGVRTYGMASGIRTATKWNYKEVCSIVDIIVRSWLDNFNDLCNDLNANTLPRGEIVKAKLLKCATDPHSKTCKAKGTIKFIKRIKALHKNVYGEQQLLELWKTTCEPMQCFAHSMDEVARELVLDYADANSYDSEQPNRKSKRKSKRRPKRRCNQLCTIPGTFWDSCKSPGYKQEVDCNKPCKILNEWSEDNPEPIYKDKDCPEHQSNCCEDKVEPEGGHGNENTNAGMRKCQEMSHKIAEKVQSAHCLPGNRDDHNAALSEFARNIDQIRETVVKHFGEIVETEGDGDYTSVYSDEAAEEFWTEVEENDYFAVVSSTMKELSKLGSDPLCKRFSEMHLGGNISRGTYKTEF